MSNFSTINTFEEMLIAFGRATKTEDIDSLFKNTSAQVLLDHSKDLEDVFLSWLTKPPAYLSSAWQAYNAGYVPDENQAKIFFNKVAFDVRMHLRAAENIAPLRGDDIDPRVAVFLDMSATMPAYTSFDQKNMVELFINASQKIQSEKDPVSMFGHGTKYLKVMS